MSHLNGYSGSPPQLPLEILLRIESRLGGLERGQDLTLDAVESVFRKIDKAHARITRAEAAISHHLQKQSGPPPTAPAGLLTSLASLSQTIAPLLPAVGLILYILAVAGVAIDPSLAKALIGAD